MAYEKACKQCRMIVQGNVCPVCKESDLTTNWKGYVVIFNIEQSEVAKLREIEMTGKYALRLSK